MRFDIITLFPEIFEFYCQHSILKKAKEKGIIKIKVHNLRDFTSDKHKTVDDKPFGGGRGMVLKIEPIYKAVQSLKSKIKSQKSKIILFTPRGKKFTQKMALEFSKLSQLILICGRYEGVDERVAKYLCDEKISIGDYVLMGGELPALVVIESVARLVPGVIGKSELLKERFTEKGGFLEYPQYTRPEVFEPKKRVKWKVPKVLLSGDHKKIEEWRKKHSKVIE
ncbi:MAG: tRNA (guanosine(37)-N1)-methyltransferase TrmD [Candidatus Nealsonbacteria bacterium]|nr:MAG: tRNA (guanosine(37)-N1)-methyltransferase TrmD [Candidatus Nealsonbacteria bacterium]